MYTDCEVSDSNKSIKLAKDLIILALGGRGSKPPDLTDPSQINLCVYCRLDRSLLKDERCAGSLFEDLPLLLCQFIQVVPEAFKLFLRLLVIFKASKCRLLITAILSSFNGLGQGLTLVRLHLAAPVRDDLNLRFYAQ